MQFAVSSRDLKRLNRTGVFADLHGDRLQRGDVLWEGPRLSVILGLAAVAPGADAVVRSDEYGRRCRVSAAELSAPDTILAVTRDGEPLAIEDGGPLRLVIRAPFGWRSIKWVRGLDLAGRDRACDQFAEGRPRAWSVAM